MGFEDCPCDPCLFKKQDHNGICYVVCYVDDNLCIGDEKAIRAVVEEIPKHGLAVTVTENMDDYLSCQVKMNKEKTKAWVGQPHMVKKIISKFKDLVCKLPKYKTPGTPGYGLILAKQDEDCIDEERHALYRTGTGMLLYCIKHSRPDISNAVRELSKCLSRPNGAAYKEMLRIIKYVYDTPELGLRMEPEIKDEWEVKVFSDSDWAGDKDTRKSVSGYLLFVCNVPVCWRSKSQAAISLSSSEAEMYALTEAVKEIPFIVQVLLFMNAKIKLPVEVKVDNMGAIYISENSMPSARTRHADLRQKFTSDLQEKGLIKIDFVKSEDNTSDIMTKNVTVELFEKHVQGLVIDKGEIDGDMSSSRKGVGRVLSDLPQSHSNMASSHNNSIGQLSQQSWK
jgi:hypothetical protein